MWYRESWITDGIDQAFGFYPDGSGKALSLTRTIDTALPGATDCLAGTGKFVDDSH